MNRRIQDTNRDLPPVLRQPNVDGTYDDGLSFSLAESSESHFHRIA
jgi:hypothetical protein